MKSNTKRCARCGASLAGLRVDARWCSSTCRTLAYRERREARLVAAAVAKTESRLMSGARGLADED